MKPNDHLRIVVDMDGTLCGAKPQGGSYLDCPPRIEVVEALRRFREIGYYVIVQSARQMRTFSNNLGEINVQTLPVIAQWLKIHDVPHDEIIVGKPWCGYSGFYVDDRAIRPSEFASMSREEIEAMLRDEQGATGQ